MDERCIALAVGLCGALLPIAAIGSVTFRQLRVVGGLDANITDTPYQLALEFLGSTYCSATIISDTFAVTASHCVQRFAPEEIVVRSGTSKRGSGGHVLKIRSITRNPKFNSAELDYDVAVIELDEAMEFGETAKAIEFADEVPAVGESVTVSGWGRTKERGSMAGNLQSANVRIMDRELCRDHYRGKVNITERMFCAGGDGQDSCHGDSGAPATFAGKLVGIVSWGFGCGRDAYPGVYANLLDDGIRDFIRNVSRV